ncbi:DNA-directed DNA polymerase epsilon, subunit B [Podila epigama]|nr:DNA-directed DNA polymerase epsilon, subunit B [Podila epigama]
MSTPKARMMSIRRQIVRVFKKHQLTLQLDAMECLEDTLEQQGVPPEDLNDTLENIALGYVAREGLELVNRGRLEVVLESMQKSTHHLHEKPTRNTLDPHRSQTTVPNSQQRRSSVQHRVDRNTLDSDTDRLRLDSMRDRIQEMEADHYGERGDMMIDDENPYENDPHQLGEDNDGDDVDITELLHVIDAFQMPRWQWASDLKTFTRVEHGTSQSSNPYEAHPHGAATSTNQVIAAAEEKTAMFRARYQLLLQRIMRNECFAPPVFTGGMESDRYLKLTPLKALKGRSGERFLMFGMLVQTGGGKYCLEDADDRVELVFQNSVFGNMDFLGAPRELRSEEQLKVISEEYEEIAFVILSDVWLDQPKTFTTLRAIFEGYSNSTLPLAFILCGSFKSQPFLYNGQESGQYRDGFTALAELIAEFPTMATFSYFIFVPGPNDPWGASILPRPKIPDFYTSKVRQLVKRSIFASNPCRIKYCNQEIVIFREDILNRLLRNCIVPPCGDVAIQKQLVRTIIDGAHLCPLPLTTRQISWAYDHALRLYPIPDALILADKFEAYNFSQIPKPLRS